ncbi:hypothetical protein [uncultured Methylobacterium sp.]|mgnify:CR=1 FL=1|jgi:hypothetical protein|uniref:hypothetical protein n=1 Tax=uncultured Methylobacterium sp. TaxID=157278 RepID=UPI00260C5594|nr:hypothetical protein [uncultured Methylobacterium sp.]
MLDSAHLLEQAERLAAPAPDGERARPTDLHRAVSATYYAVFHAGLTAAADQCLGRDNQGTELYSLAYRSVDHIKMKALCRQVLQREPSPTYKRYVPNGGWGADITAYADGFVTLNEQRMLADYDPTYVISPSEVTSYVLVGRTAIRLLDKADPAARRAFLTLLLFPPR